MTNRLHRIAHLALDPLPELLLPTQSCVATISERARLARALRLRIGNSICSWTTTVGKRRANRLLNEAQAADEEIGNAGAGRWRGGVERFEVRQRRELIQTRKQRGVRIVGIDRDRRCQSGSPARPDSV